MRCNIGVARVAASLPSQNTEGEPCPDTHQRRPLHDRLACQAAAASRLCTATSSYCEPSHAHASKPVGHLASGRPIPGIKLCGTAFQQLRISWMPTRACRQTKQSSGRQYYADLADCPSRCCQTNETKTEVDGLVSSRLYLQRQLRARRNRGQRASYRRPEACWSGWGPSLQMSHWRSCPSAGHTSDFVGTQVPTTVTQSPRARQPLMLPEHQKRKMVSSALRATWTHACLPPVVPDLGLLMLNIMPALSAHSLKSLG